MYFPEIEHFIRSDHSDWLIHLLLRFPTPSAITSLASADFVAQAWSLVGRKVHKAALLAEIYAAAQRSIALPATPDSAAVAMLRLVQYLRLGRMRESIAQQAEIVLASNPDRRRLMTVPGVGPLTALMILAEAGGLRRFAHYRQFLKFCGMNLSTQQSVRFRGISRLSKYGNARLRTAFLVIAQAVPHSSPRHRHLMMSLRQLLRVVGASDQRIMPGLAQTSLEHVQDNLRILRVVLVPGVVHRLASAG